MTRGAIYLIGAAMLILGTLFLCRRTGDYRKRTFYRTLYTANVFELILLGWRLLGKPGSFVITRLIGLGYALTHPATIRAVRANIALLDPSRATFATACRLFINQAQCFSNYGLLAMKEPAAVMDLLGKKEGFEHLQRAHQTGKGCLLVTGHLGFFELGGLVMREMGFPITALTLPEPSTELTKWRADFRARWGVQTIVVGKDEFSVVEIVRALSQGAFVALLIDRPYDGKGIPVPLPHGEILFSTAPVLIALLAHCSIIPVGVIQQPDGKHHIEAHTPIEPQWLTEGREATLEHYTRQIAASLIPLFNRAPDQWYQFSPLACEPSPLASTPSQEALL
jgi:lauroyl/myristoyl acyltransferase